MVTSGIAELGKLVVQRGMAPTLPITDIPYPGTLLCRQPFRTLYSPSGGSVYPARSAAQTEFCRWLMHLRAFRFEFGSGVLLEIRAICDRMYSAFTAPNLTFFKFGKISCRTYSYTMRVLPVGNSGFQTTSSNTLKQHRIALSKRQALLSFFGFPFDSL